MTVPTILSGPIVRRVEPKKAYIWISTSEPYQIGAELYSLSTRQENNEPTLVSDRTKTKTVQFGENLYIHLIKILPLAQSFPVNTLLGYNLLFTKDFKTMNLHDFGLLDSSNPESIVYGDLPYPSFYINDSEVNNILYGSCRKPHGKGDDALYAADIQLQEDFENVEQRPSSLFLMGDQIYADDVADPLLPALSSYDKQLMGNRREKISEIEPKLSTKSFQNALNQVHGRQFIMEHFAEFTSNNAYNHLMTFGEFAAMYMMSWGPQMWNENTLTTFESILDQNKLYFVHPEEKRYEEERLKELEQHELRFNEQLKDVNTFKRNLPSVRRLLANIPTYMIFDDHDLTDDWNISHDWQKNVSNSHLGRHVIANGLAAYWAFQGWGNDPEAFDDTFIELMSAYFQSLTFAFAPYKNSLYEDWINRLWHFDQWFFIAPTSPKALFLDTRTMRSFDPLPRPVKIGSIIEEVKDSPNLIGIEGWEKISKHLTDSKWSNEESLMIISPAPLYGIGVIESFLKHYVYPLRVLGIPVHYQLDFEAWKYNGKGFDEFLHRILKWGPKHCFILSGDSHFASSVYSHVDFHGGQDVSIYQFTSSPIHNMSFSGFWGFLLKNTLWFNSQTRKRKVIHRSCDYQYNLHKTDREPDINQVKWKENIRYLSTEEDSIVELQNNIGLLTLSPNRARNALLQYDQNKTQKTITRFKPIHLKSNKEKE
ncbi:hypothetical protein HNQ94_002225 [Salirhabdus euzebyi]|uniref:PhoD-like phosphatase metallophosphatase domain-containing protein n=1 Tax=Salirhabdus euzebyi TaxID=394506 RepID=A0A841Q5X4_9BACI|nr:hypothetical protein [Salirhabdus euzebyi]MBB6453774.1 hypothetical protein [Salirhabdus euzebyi]